MPIGGGGLIAGIAVAIKRLTRQFELLAQSENVHGMAASYYAGAITSHRTTGTGPMHAMFHVREISHEIVRELVDDIVLVMKMKS